MGATENCKNLSDTRESGPTSFTFVECFETLRKDVPRGPNYSYHPFLSHFDAGKNPVTSEAELIKKKLQI